VNCRRIQSLLSAYLDGELTGEEMISVRHHLSACEYCGDEYRSLQVVKKLLGSLDSIDASGEWSNSVTAKAYAGSRPWWEKTISNEWLSIQLVRPLDSAELSPRGTRMVRALALSAMFVFLAAVPISIEHMDEGVTGRMDSIAPSFFALSVTQRPHLQSIGSIFQSGDASRYISIDPQPLTANQHFDALSASAMPAMMQPSFPSDNSLTLLSTAQK